MKCRENDSNFALIVVCHTEAYLNKFNVSRDEFVMERLIPKLVDSGGLEADTVGDAEAYLKYRKSKCKQIERMMKGDTPLPAAFMLPWVAALPNEYRKRCQIDLAACLGTVFTPLKPMKGPFKPQAVRSRLNEVSREFADVLQHSEPAMDGLYNEQDDEDVLQQLQDELYELHAAVLNEMGRIFRARGIQPRGHTMMINSPLFMEG